jgi:hypothetical protein
VKIGKCDPGPRKKGQVQVTADGKRAARGLGHLFLNLGLVLLEIYKARNDQESRNDQHNQPPHNDGDPLYRFFHHTPPYGISPWLEPSADWAPGPHERFDNSLALAYSGDFRKDFYGCIPL